MNENIGAVVETLIQIKKDYTLTAYEAQAINLACNILDSRFDRLDSPDYVTKNHLAVINWFVQDISTGLVQAGFANTKENINLVLSDDIKNNIIEKSIDGGWEAIYKEIDKHQGQLIKLEELK